MSDQVEITAAIVTTSDSRSREDDLSGRKLKELLEAYGAAIASHTVVPAEVEFGADELFESDVRRFWGRCVGHRRQRKSDENEKY